MRSLRGQFITSHLLLVMLMGVVMSGASITFYQITQSIDRVLQGNFKTIQAAHEMTTALHEEEMAMTMLADGEAKDAEDLYNRATTAFDNGYAVASKMANSPPQRALLKHLNTESIQSKARVKELFRSQTSTKKNDLRTRVIETLRPELRDTRDLTEALLLESRSAIVRDNDVAMSRANQAFFKSVLITILAIGAAVMVALFMVGRILTPLQELAEYAESVGRGNLEPRLLKPRQDEVGTLTLRFGEMVARVAEARQMDAKTIRRLERISETALECMYDPLIVTDVHQCIIRLNPAAEKIFGIAPESPRKPVNEMVSDPRILNAIEKAVKSEIVSASEDESSQVNIKVNGEIKTYRLRVTPMKGSNDRVVGSVTVLEDITHLKVVDKMKSEFIGVASHDLRSPVTSLILANHLLREGVAGPLTQDQIEVIESQRQDLERLEHLMRDLLDVTKLEAGASLPRLHTSEVLDLVREPVETLRIQAERKGLDLAIEIPLTISPVLADKLQIGRVITNLVANAIRHTPSNGTITIRASESGNEVTLSVEDTGEGIPEAYRRKIFDQFVQVPGAPQGGAGLGLSIARKIVKAHGGDMSVESQIGIGSKFRFTLTKVSNHSELEGKS